MNMDSSSSHDHNAGCLSQAFQGIKSIFRTNKVVPGSSSKKTQEGALEVQYAPACHCDFNLYHSNGKSVEQPPTYEDDAGDALLGTEVVQTIEGEVDRLNDDLRALSLRIHGHPEIGYQEKFAHHELTTFMSNHGFKVTPHYLGLKTAFRAEFTHGKGGRVLGVNSEMDALPGIGHACGHNLIAVSGVGIAIAAKTALQKHNIPGTVVLLGTPAEEDTGGKIILLERGAYKDMDLCVMCHPSQGPLYTAVSVAVLATRAIEVEFFGHSAHAGGAPWEAQNALDAAFLAYSAISVLRQQMKPDCRVHGVVEGKDWRPNIIPDYAKLRYLVRAPTRAVLDELVGRVNKCFEAAALATSCRVNIVLRESFFDLRQNSALSCEFAKVMKRRFDMPTIFQDTPMGASTDFGNVTYELPAFHPAYTIPTSENGGNHTPQFAHSAATLEAHAATMLVTKGLAIIGVRALVDNTFFANVKKTFKDSQESGQAPR